MDNMNDFEELLKHTADLVKIARLVIDLSDNGVSALLLLSSLASAIDILIEKYNLDYNETWSDLYTTARIINEHS